VNLKPLVVPEKRGKAGKVTIELVHRIIEKAKGYPRHRIRLKRFAADLKMQEGIDLGSKTLEKILIANDLYKARTRKKRPKFYQSLCKKIPNGLLSIDGSEMIVWLSQTPYRFNVELAVDVTTFAHTAFCIADTETADAVIKVLESHRRNWGVPVGVLSDHGSANRSEWVKDYMDELGIKPVPVGPANPKGNGSDEGAFSHMKKALGYIRINSSSPKEMARSILNAMVSVYIYMRNRLPVHNRKTTPAEHMVEPASVEQRNIEHQLLDKHVAAKDTDEEDQPKIDRLHWVVRHYSLEVAPDALKHAERTIKWYALEAIRQTETAFLKATRRKDGRRNLSYFFGILKNIQQKLDDDAKKEYCRKRYNHQVMLKLECQKNERQGPTSINDVISMLEKAVTIKVRSVKALAIRKAREWIHELMKSCRYLGSLKKKIGDALGNLRNLSTDQKEEAWELFCQFLINNKQESRVTLSS